MSSRIDEYLNKEAAAETQYLEYGLMAFMALIFMRFLSEYIATKRNRQSKKNKMLLEATKMKYMARMSMARMSMAAAASRGGGGGGGGGSGGGGGGGGSNK